MTPRNSTIIEERTVSFDEVINDSGLMVRVELNQDAVLKYAALMREGTEFPPLDCMQIDGELFLYDGFHRREASKVNGAVELKVRIHQGTHRDAFRAAVKAGAHTGVRFTNADKGKIVGIYLADEAWGARSNRWIAAEVGVDHVFVGKARKWTSTGDDHQLSAANKPNRLGRDGKERRAPRPRRSPTNKPAAPPPAPRPQPKSVDLSMKFSKEELGVPPPDIADEPDPVLPNHTRMQAWIRRWGAVHLQTPAQRVLTTRQKNLMSFSGAVRDFGEAADKFLKRKGLRIPGTLPGEPGHDPELATSFTAEDYLAIAATIENGGIVWRRKLEQHLNALVTALRILEPFHRALMAQSENTSQADPGPADLPEMLRRDSPAMNKL